VVNVLDWGCGWGAIALWLAVGFPFAKVVALDSDIAAVKATTFNKELNQLKNLEIVPSHGFDELNSETKFDLICSNPPTHRGRKVVEDMIHESLKRLKPNGHLLIVVEARLKPWVATALKNTFGDYKIEKRGPKNVVLSAHKFNGPSL
jgi:16S rRNA G1207 methylase RsmC